jgi:hypothetical protein
MIVRESGLRLLQGLDVPRASLVLADPIYPELKLLCLSPYAIGVFAFEMTDGQSSQIGSSGKLGLEWMIVYRDPETNELRSVSCLWRELVDRVSVLTRELTEKLDLRDQGAFTVEPPPEENLIGLLPFNEYPSEGL